MPRFYFNSRDDICADDPEGVELLSVEDAKLRARAFAIELVATTVKEQQRFALDHRIEVTDEAGNIVHTVRFGDVVKINP